MPKRPTPKGCYWRGEILWARVMVKGIEHRWSLRTGDAKAAVRWRDEERKRLIGEAHFGEKRTSYEAAFAAWSEHLVGHVSPKTAARYAMSLKQIDHKLRPLFVDEINAKVVSEIVNERRIAGKTNATIRRDLTALSGLLGYAEDEEWREGNPALDRLRRLREKRDPIILPDLANVMEVIGRAPGHLAQMIHAALLTGCRQDELVTAQRTRVNHDRRQMTVVGKGNKLRVIQLSDAAYVVVASIPASLRSKWLFWHGDGEPYRNVASRFAGIVKSARISAQSAGRSFRPFRFHDLRHLYAVRYLKDGGGVYDLQHQLGHGSIKTTEIYLAYLTADEARDAKAGPALISAQ